MTIDELRVETKQDLAAISQKIDDLAADVVETKAVLTTDKERRGEEIGALFVRTSEHSHRIGAIEARYVPRAELEDRVNELKGAIGRQTEQLGNLNVHVGRLMLQASAVAAILAVGLSAAVRFVMGG